jgi:hypothetical protein
MYAGGSRKIMTDVEMKKEIEKFIFSSPFSLLSGCCPARDFSTVDDSGNNNEKK